MDASRTANVNAFCPPLLQEEFHRLVVDRPRGSSADAGVGRTLFVVEIGLQFVPQEFRGPFRDGGFPSSFRRNGRAANCVLLIQKKYPAPIIYSFPGDVAVNNVKEFLLLSLLDLFWGNRGAIL